MITNLTAFSLGSETRELHEKLNHHLQAKLEISQQLADHDKLLQQLQNNHSNVHRSFQQQQQQLKNITNVLNKWNEAELRKKAEEEYNMPDVYSRINSTQMQKSINYVKEKNLPRVGIVAELAYVPNETIGEFLAKYLSGKGAAVRRFL